MQRAFTLILAVILVMGLAVPALAVEDYIHVYYEAVLNDRTTYAGNENELNQYMVNADFAMNNYKFGLDSSYGTLYDRTRDLNTDFLAYKIKGGVSVYNQEQTRIYLTGGYYQNNYELGGDDNTFLFKSLFTGIDLQLILSDRLWFDANYMVGIQPKVEIHQDAFRPSKEDMTSIDILNLRLNLSLTAETALTFGYNSESLLNDDAAAGSGAVVKNKGYTIGVCYRY